MKKESHLERAKNTMKNTLEEAIKRDEDKTKILEGIKAQELELERRKNQCLKSIVEKIKLN